MGENADSTDENAQIRQANIYSCKRSERKFNFVLVGKCLQSIGRDLGSAGEKAESLSDYLEFEGDLKTRHQKTLPQLGRR